MEDLRKRHGNNYFFDFCDDVFIKNQESPFPVSRKDFYNVAQEFWREFQTRSEQDGPEQVYNRMKLEQPYRIYRKKDDKNIAL